MPGFYADRMGPSLLREVERQLLEDLTNYGVSGESLQIEWWDACGEGHDTCALGGTLEEMSGLALVDHEQNTVARGWMDFIQGGGDDPLHVFWLLLSVRIDGEWHQVKRHINASCAPLGAAPGNHAPAMR